MSQHLRLPHDPLRLLADFTRHFIGIALLEFWQEKLHGKRPRVTFIREFAQDACEWTYPVARYKTRGLVEQFARHIRHVLKVSVRDLAGTDAVDIVQLIVAGPEVV